MQDPELEFHRYFGSEFLSRRDRRNFPGRLDTATLDEGFASVLTAVQHHINQMFSRQSGRIQTANGPVQLHLDYIAAPDRPVRNANAIAFAYNGFFFIGLTLDLVESMFEVCSLLSRSSASGDLLGVKLDTREKRDLFLACLFSVQVQFVIDHELGHHFHGHTGSSFFSEYDREESSSAIGKLKDQAHEVEADGYAAHMMLKAFFTEDAGPGLVRTLQPDSIESDEFLVLYLLLAIGSYMFLRPQHAFDPARVREESHPFGLMRMNVVMVDLEGWAAEHRSGLLSYINQDNFQRVMGTVVAAHPGSAAVNEWKLQGEFLRSGDGGYRDDLYAARALLRKEMYGRAWSLGGQIVPAG